MNERVFSIVSAAGFLCLLSGLFLSSAGNLAAAEETREISNLALEGTRVERIDALRKISEMENHRAELVPVLASVLREDPYHPARGLAASNLGRFGGEKALEALLAALEKEEDHRPLWMIIEALGEIGDSRATKRLVGFTEHPDRSIRWVTVGSLGMIGDSDAKEALEKTHREDGDQGVRSMAGWALDQL